MQPQSIFELLKGIEERELENKNGSRNWRPEQAGGKRIRTKTSFPVQRCVPKFVQTPATLLVLCKEE